LTLKYLEATLSGVTEAGLARDHASEAGLARDRVTEAGLARGHASEAGLARDRVTEAGLARGHGAGWIWGDPAGGIPADAPLHTLLLAASRVMGAFYAGLLAEEGLRISPAGLGVLRVLLAGDGLKSSDVAARGWSSPGTLTSVVNTLVREALSKS